MVEKLKKVFSWPTKGSPREGVGPDESHHYSDTNIHLEGNLIAFDCPFCQELNTVLRETHEIEIGGSIEAGCNKCREDVVLINRLDWLENYYKAIAPKNLSQPTAS